MTGPQHCVVDAVGQQADDGVTLGRPFRQFGRGERHVVIAGRDDLVARLQQRVGAARGQAAGDEDPGHPQWVV